MRRFSLLSLMAVTALSLSLSACDDKKQQDQSQQAQGEIKPGMPPVLQRDLENRKKEEARRSIPQQNVVLKFGEATSFATAEGATAGAVFLRITSEGPGEAYLKGATATVGTVAELHQTTIDENGTASMRKMTQFAINPESHLVLNPTGPHIMILGLTNPLKEGDTFKVTLDFENAEDVTLPVKVVAPAAEDHSHHHGSAETVTHPDALQKTIKAMKDSQKAPAATSPATDEHQHEHPAQ